MKHLIYLLLLFPIICFGQINPKYFPIQTTPGDSVTLYTFEGESTYNKPRKFYLTDLKTNYFAGLFTNDGLETYLTETGDNFSIGTTASSGYKFRVQGTARMGASTFAGSAEGDKEFTAASSATDGGITAMYNGGVGSTVGIWFLVDNAAQALRNHGGFIGFKKTTTKGRGDLIFALKSAAVDSTDVTSDTDERMRITRTGRMGMGTSAPQSTIDVEGNMAVGASYSGTTAAPTNGMIIEGNVGIGTTSPTEPLDINGDFITRAAVIKKVIYPPQVTGNLDNYAPTGINACVYVVMDFDGAYEITGISSTGIADGQELYLINTSVYDQLVKHQSTSSSANNRFFCPDLTDVTLRPGVMPLLYLGGKFYVKNY